MDLEMTGLNPETDVIVEIATLVTDDELNIIAEGPNLVIFQPEEAMASMGDFCHSDAHHIRLARAHQDLNHQPRRRPAADSRLHQGTQS